MKRVVVAALVVAGVGLGVFNAPAEGATGHAGVMVGSVTFKYAKGTCGTNSSDGSFEVEVGDSVTWTNCTQAAHTVTGDSFGNTTTIANGESVSYTFLSPGSFPYHCDIHSNMTGVVNVTGPAPTVPATTATTATPTTVKPTTTTASTVKPTTTTTEDDLGGIFTLDPTSSTTSTTGDPTVTTRALGEGGDGGTSAGTVGLLVVGLGTVGTAAALIIRRMRGGPVLPD